MIDKPPKFDIALTIIMAFLAGVVVGNILTTFGVS